MAEHTDRKTGARGVFRRVADFAKRKLQSNRLNTNPNRELRDMTEEELVIMMEAAFDAPAFSQDSDRLSFFRECFVKYLLLCTFLSGRTIIPFTLIMKM